MAKYILKRLLISVATIWAIATICFFLIRMLPGNPFIVANPLDMTNAEKLMDYYGLNDPLWQQYLRFMNNLVHLNFGYSLAHAGRSVNDVIIQYFPVTAQLALQAMIIGIPTGILLGIISAGRRGGAVDLSTQLLTILTTAIPSYVLAAVLQLVLSVRLGLLPAGGWTSFRHTIIPTLCLALGLVASHCRSMRTLMLEVGQQDYLKTAKAKGLSRVRITVFHQIRNAILPLITNLGLEIAGLLMGSYVIEKIFSIPGLGRYFVTSINELDYTMALGLVVFQAVVVVAANFIVDLVYGLIDPRVKIM
ncbi:MAG: ABC transporter permease [Lachnospiraceae bacterium]|nr:ABC transporter permease [Lachnospiraceae bacterium]